MSKDGERGDAPEVQGRPVGQFAIRIEDPETRRAIDSILVEIRRIGDRIEDVAEHVAGKPRQTKYMTKKEVAEYLHESVRQVDRRRARGELPDGVKLGRRRLFLREEIDAIDLSEIRKGEVTE